MDGLRVLSKPMIFNNPSPWIWHSISRRHYNLWICMEGEGKMRCGSRTYPISPWTAFILPPQVAVHGVSTKGAGGLKNFSAHWLPVGIHQSFACHNLYGLRLFEVDTVQSLIQSLVRLSVHDDPLAEQHCEWIVLQILALIWREVQTPQRSESDRLIFQQIERIRSGEDLFISVDELAREAKRSRVHYSRCFKKIQNETPNQFLIQQRVERACILLRETDWTIEVLAERLGYSDVYFFCRQFKRVMRMTPRQYRQGRA